MYVCMYTMMMMMLYDDVCIVGQHWKLREKCLLAYPFHLLFLQNDNLVKICYINNCLWDDNAYGHGRDQ